MAMAVWPAWAIAIFALIIASRLLELVHARRNTARLLSEGGQEHYPGHFPLFFLVHGGWLIAIALFADPPQTPRPVLLMLFVASQVGRVWVLATLGRWWTTRIVSAPHFPRITKGPYRFVRHPNYWVVIAEIAVIPLLLGAPWVALAFSLLNAALLTFRIRLENTVLKERDRAPT